MTAAPKVVITASIIIGRPKYDCKKGIWVCFPTPIISLENDRVVKTNIADNQNGTVTITFNSPLPESGNMFYADSDEITGLSAADARALGYNSVSFVPGSYKISPPSDSNYGSVTINVKTY